MDKIREEKVESNIFKNPRQEREGAFVTDLNFNLENKKKNKPLNVFEEIELMYFDNCHEGKNRSIQNLLLLTFSGVTILTRTGPLLFFLMDFASGLPPRKVR